MTDKTPEQQFAEALAAFQESVPHIAKGQRATVKSDKGNYSYDYADLTDITEVALPALAKQGLSFSAKPTVSGGDFVLHYTLRHVGGHQDDGDFPLPDPSKYGAQQIGSWLTYARRYALCAVTGIAPGGDDDDAVRAGDARAVDPLQAPQRAQRRNARDINPQTDPDEWATATPTQPERVTDAAWIDGFHSRLAACTKPSEVRGLDGEAHVAFAEGRLTADDAKTLKGEIDARMKELGA